jgi:Mg2+ and Co2+ transporter CorA
MSETAPLVGGKAAAGQPRVRRQYGSIIVNSSSAAVSRNSSFAHQMQPIPAGESSTPPAGAGLLGQSFGPSSRLTPLNGRWKSGKWTTDFALEPDPHVWLAQQNPDEPVTVKFFETIDHLFEHLQSTATPGGLRTGVSPPGSDFSAPQNISPTKPTSPVAASPAGSSPYTAAPSPPFRIIPRTTAEALAVAWRQDSDSSSSSESESDAPIHSPSAAHRKASRANYSTQPQTHPFRWLDIQSNDLDVVRAILGVFPVEQNAMKRMVELEVADSVEIFASGNFVLVNLTCTPTASGLQRRREDGSGTFRPEHYLPDPDHAVCTLLLFEDWLITVHTGPFNGLHDLLTKVQHATHRRAIRNEHFELAPSLIAAMLVDLSISATLPDPNPLLAEANSCDELALTTHSGDHLDMLRRIAHVRRRIGSGQSHLYQKDRLLQQFLAPELRSTFVTRSAKVAEIYSRCQGQISAVIDRFGAAREILNQAGSNITSSISLEMSKVNNEMSAQMRILTQAAAVCLPLGIVTGTLGMNLPLPYQHDPTPGESLVPFFLVCGVMGCWLAFAIPFLIFDWRRSARMIAVPALEEKML